MENRNFSDIGRVGAVETLLKKRRFQPLCGIFSPVGQHCKDGLQNMA